MVLRAYGRMGKCRRLLPGCPARLPPALPPEASDAAPAGRDFEEPLRLGENVAHQIKK